MLSPEQFAELLHLIETMRDEGPKPEVRRAQRVAHPCRITITRGTNDNAGPGIVVQLKDISARGISLLHNEEISRGANFVVKLSDTHGANVTILCEVVYSRRVDKDLFHIGAQFTCVLGKKEEATDEQLLASRSRISSTILQ